jgi:hypothetical protein
MFRLPSDGFVVSKTETSVIKRCPFCDGPIEDSLGKDIKFLMHLGTATPKHQLKQAWADYIAFINRI